jgi:D-alanyl-lipoteichoic acid acyltransferase DltB (MBOAT superfamily)
MLFNSFDFGFFLVIVYLLYWSVGVHNRRAQNIILLVASYVFYGLWDWRFLSLIFLSSIVDYYAALGMQASKSIFVKRIFLFGSIFWNLGVLFAFKYFNFFLDSFTSLFYSHPPNEGYFFWNVIIPVGLSFYTFQTMSYSIDVYQKTIKANKNIIEFLCFVSFFPQLVAGPIERARKLLPQFKNHRVFDLTKSKEGLRQMIWGLFKKVVVADNLAVAVNIVYAEPEAYGSLILLYASVLFFFQIYCDFSGYSDIAIGTAKLFGFELSKNFNIPYLSRSVSELWHRWHITLTRWFTDYVYTPIARLKKQNYAFKTFALFLSMTLIGFWHGANWTFIAFGALQAAVISIERIPFKINGKKISLIRYIAKMPLPLIVIYMFVHITTSIILFRAETIDDAITVIHRIWSFIPSENFDIFIGWRMIFLPILILAEVCTRFKTYPLIALEKYLSRPIRWALYYMLIFIIFRYAGPQEAFIYFQF